MTSTTQRSKKHMEEQGYHVEIVEHWNSWARRRVDLFGFVDLLCLGVDEVVGVQTTSGTNVSSRVKKIAEHQNVGAVRKAGIRIIVHGWTKDKSGRYRLREVDCS